MQTIAGLHANSITGSYLLATAFLKVFLYMSHVARKMIFDLSVGSFFQCACSVLEQSQMSSSLAEVFPWLTAYVSEQHRFRQDCANAQARLNLCFSHIFYTAAFLP